MDDHRHPPRAFHELKDADVALTKLVVAHKLEKLAALEASGGARVIISDAPLVFPIWPAKCDLTCSAVEVIGSKPNGDDLHKNIGCVSIVSRSRVRSTKFT